MRRLLRQICEHDHARSSKLRYTLKSYLQLISLPLPLPLYFCLAVFFSLSHSLILYLYPCLPFLTYLSIYTYFSYFSFLGMIQYAVDAIKGSLDDLPGLPRTNFGNIISPSLFRFTQSSFSFSTCFSPCSFAILFFDFFIYNFLPTSQVS